jgi:hypothetical protein
MSNKNIEKILAEIKQSVEEITKKIDNNEEAELGLLQEKVEVFCQEVNAISNIKESELYNEYINSIKDIFRIWHTKLSQKQALIKKEIESLGHNTKAQKAYINSNFIDSKTE